MSTEVCHRRQGRRTPERGRVRSRGSWAAGISLVLFLGLGKADDAAAGRYTVSTTFGPIFSLDLFTPCRYELLDEAMDFGLPQITDPTVLKSLIFQKGFRSEFGFEVGSREIISLRGGDSGPGSEACSMQEKKKADPNATLQVTGAVSWRREGIKYKKNEVFLDLVEQVNLLMSSNGEWSLQADARCPRNVYQGYAAHHCSPSLAHHLHPPRNHPPQRRRWAHPHEVPAI